MDGMIQGIKQSKRERLKKTESTLWLMKMRSSCKIIITYALYTRKQGLTEANGPFGLKEREGSRVE